ncbi:carbohydrate porin [Robiginitalea aurantiaca]|uniref:Carbohydrate porin n=1 Tax=Robiginitalea aurantiaca TaxID=3056915 RepID=A0ABT7WFK9_9FLAO|nr:carbohydrate porin [Robiginitalea aurantiaca]MDM9631706.1 carbohydrate porin [Robiginitalea aurantiaca]
MNYRKLFLLEVVMLLPLLSVVAQEDKMQLDTIPEKSGYTSDLQKGINSITTFFMLEDDKEKNTLLRLPLIDSLSQPYYDWKRQLNERTGFIYSLTYSSTNMWGRSSPEKVWDYSGSGFLKFYSRWTLVNRNKLNTGVLAVGVDHRHSYSPFPPGSLGFELGYNGIPALLFTDAKWMLIDLNWQQKFNNGRTGVIIGRYDPNDYFDVLGYVNPFTTFQNLAILLNPSIAFPDLSTGIGASHWITDQVLISATVNDANGLGTEVKFFNDFDELYKSVELSWSPSRDMRFFKNFHVTYWHADARDRAELEESQGIAIGGNWTFHETLMPFFKAGWSQGSAPIYSQSYTGGFILKPNLNKDLFGLGVNWGQTQSDIWQFSSELFYRFQFSQNFAITPSVQYFKNPALDPNLNSAFVVGLRGRLAL